MKLTDVEFILLQTLNEQEEASGYKIIQWLKERERPSRPVLAAPQFTLV